MIQCNEIGEHGRCTNSWKKQFGAKKTNCKQKGLSHVFKPKISHTDKDEDEDKDGDLTTEANDTSNTSFKESSVGMTTRSSSQTTRTTSPVGSAADMVRLTSRHNDYQKQFEDGMALCLGLDFKLRDEKRGRSMIEAAALSGFSMAVAFCLLRGWDQNHPVQCSNGSGSVDNATCGKRAVAMYVNIEQETNGYHWAQHFLGECCDYGDGTDQDYTKAVEWYTKSSEQGNSCAMADLGFCCEMGYGCGRRRTKAVQLYEKSAKLGDSQAMYNLGKCYEEGNGVVKDLDIAQEWYTKAVAQDHARAKKCKRLHEEYKKSEEGKKLSCNKRKNKQKHNKTKRTKT